MGEREERLREALPKGLQQFRIYFDIDATKMGNVFADVRIEPGEEFPPHLDVVALASSPSPPDREQAVEKVKKVLRERTVAHPSVMAEWIVAALFGRGDDK